MSAQILKIVTINTWKCDGDYQSRMQALERQLAERNPDVVAVQESFASIDGSLDTAARLGRCLGLNVCFVPARRKRRNCDGLWVDSYSGLALLSRYPFSQCLEIPLPSSIEDGGRSAQVCLINVGAQSVLVANVHLPHLAGGGELRRPQLEAVLSHELFRCSYDAALVCGDFNADRQAPELHHYLGPPWRLLDTHVAGGGGEKTTCVGADGNWRDLDHIFSIPCRHGQLPEFSDSAVVLNSADALSGVKPSDHCGVETHVILAASFGSVKFVI
ncbi:MAG: endonuclease/exonuclease/phosphatase family protein [Polynucleobacter sp.]|nr:endonuclease/exonuclease/phosphatase family protein [Polynucleobacter sp.]